MTGTPYFLSVCIDGHTVDIIAADGAPVEPYTTNCFIIYTAERYDVVVKPETAGDYLIRFSTTEQQTAMAFEDPSIGPYNYTEGFPHFGYAILRVTASDGAAPALLSDFEPPACDNLTTVNCGTDYVCVMFLYLILAKILRALIFSCSLFLVVFFQDGWMCCWALRRES
jgi:FtsP/CotA-like multicopper oxidase with cupredoxin domain